MIRKLLVIGLALAFAAPLAAADPATFQRPYDVAGQGGAPLGGLIINIGVFYGGAVFPAHPHDTTATITIDDTFNGRIEGIVCQDLNSDSLCDTRNGSPDRWACVTGGHISGFDIDEAPDPYHKQVYVFVYTGLWRIPECDGRVAEGTNGVITVSYA